MSLLHDVMRVLKAVEYRRNFVHIALAAFHYRTTAHHKLRRCLGIDLCRLYHHADSVSTYDDDAAVPLTMFLGMRLYVTFLPGDGAKGKPVNREAP